MSAKNRLVDLSEEMGPDWIEENQCRLHAPLHADRVGDPLWVETLARIAALEKAVAASAFVDHVPYGPIELRVEEREE